MRSHLPGRVYLKTIVLSNASASDCCGGMVVGVVYGRNHNEVAIFPVDLISNVATRDYPRLRRVRHCKYAYIIISYIILCYRAFDFKYRRTVYNVYVIYRYRGHRALELQILAPNHKDGYRIYLNRRVVCLLPHFGRPL